MDRDSHSNAAKSLVNDTNSHSNDINSFDVNLNLYIRNVLPFAQWEWFISNQIVPIMIGVMIGTNLLEVRDALKDGAPIPWSVIGLIVIFLLCSISQWFVWRVRRRRSMNLSSTLLQQRQAELEQRLAELHAVNNSWKELHRVVFGLASAEEGAVASEPAASASAATDPASTAAESAPVGVREPAPDPLAATAPVSETPTEA